MSVSGSSQIAGPRVFLAIFAIVGLVTLFVWFSGCGPKAIQDPPINGPKEQPIPERLKQMLHDGHDAQLKSDWCRALTIFQDLQKELATKPQANQMLGDEVARNRRMLETLCMKASPNGSEVEVPPKKTPPEKIPEEVLLERYPSGKSIRSVGHFSIEGKGRNTAWGLRGTASFSYRSEVPVETRVLESDPTFGKLVFQQSFGSVVQICAVSNQSLELVVPDSLPLRTFWPVADGQFRWLSPGYRVFRRVTEALNFVDPGLKRTLTAFSDALRRGGVKLNSSDEVKFFVQTEKLTGTKFRIAYLSGIGVTAITQVDGESKFGRDELIRLAHASTVMVDHFIFPLLTRSEGEKWEVRADDVGSLFALYDPAAELGGRLKLSREADETAGKLARFGLVGGTLEAHSIVDGMAQEGRMTVRDGFAQFDLVDYYVEGVHVLNRLGPNFNLTIEPGEFLAIVGGSGAGKSTLIKVLAGIRGLANAGRVTMLESDGETWNRSQNLTRFREALGYVSQDAILHEELNPKQILTMSSQLRAGTANVATVESALMRAEIESERWQLPVRDLSGGQNRRVRTASELMGEPRLLLLDEPGSGLDGLRRYSLMRFLRSLSWQGCTVVIVTHEITDLDKFCDRIVTIDIGLVHSDRRISSPSALSPSMQVDRAVRRNRRASRLQQLWLLAGRELSLLMADPIRRLGLPAIVAVLFALSISIAVQQDDAPLLGFLAIVSVLWMSASLSLLGIAGEWEVFDHERQLFLSVPSYLSAKTVVYFALSICQTAVFFLMMFCFRKWLLERDMLYEPLHTLLILMIVGTAGVGWGLVLSALAGRRKETATFLLPLVMVAQIVFSVPIAQHDRTHDSVGSAYREFHIGRPHETPDTSDRSNSAVRWAALASYLTVSRQADFALRSFAYHAPESADDLGNPGSGWTTMNIVAWMTGLLIMTLVLLLDQPSAWIFSRSEK